MNDAPSGPNRTRRAHVDLAVVLGLVVVHEVLLRSLAGNAIVSALFAPSGAHTWTTLLLGLVFLAVRVVLLVVVPGWIAARALLALCTMASRRGAS